MKATTYWDIRERQGYVVLTKGDWVLSIPVDEKRFQSARELEEKK